MGSITIGPCAGCCDNPCVGGALSCIIAGGTACLCGYNEFVSPSTPPRRYRRLTQDNTQNFTHYSFDTCSDSPDPRSCTLSGVGQYDPDTCELVVTGSNNCGGVVLGPFLDSCGIKATTTQTLSTQAMDGSPCCAAGIIASFRYTSVTGSAELDDEDTEDDAIRRLMSGASWGSCSGSPCCLAQWEARTAGFCFAYQEAIWTVVASGLVPGKNYKIPVDFYDRVFGVGPYTLFQHLLVEVEADNFGNAVASGFVPNQRGYQTYAVAGDCP